LNFFDFIGKPPDGGFFVGSLEQFARIGNQRKLLTFTLIFVPNPMSLFSSPSPWRSFQSLLVGGLVTAGNMLSLSPPAVAQQATPEQYSTDYCFLSPAEIDEKNRLRSAALGVDNAAKQRYVQILQRHTNTQRTCREQSWLKTQAIWMRMYPCDSRPGAVDELLDQLVNKGYNQIYLATFYAGRVLLPQVGNTTAWPSALDSYSVRNVDLLAEVIRKGRARGLKVYAWMYSLNFGSNYGLFPNRDTALNVNGRGEKSWFVGNEGTQSPDAGGPNSILFVNPHSTTARDDFNKMVSAVLQRRPDGILFDYIRYPRGQGAQSVISSVKDLWIYGTDARQKLEATAKNRKGAELLKIYLDNGNIRPEEITAADVAFPDELAPLWGSRSPAANELKMTPAARVALYQKELWQLAVDFAANGVVEFLTEATTTAQRMGVRSGAVFFPEANRPVGRGFDSRLQRWNKFPGSIEWHPMAYGICGQTKCIEDQVTQVLRSAPETTPVIPVLAGVWGKSYENRPSLELQMAGIHRSSPSVNELSHFSYSWQEPTSDFARSSCRLRQ
jgi:hypothetical protein